MPHSPHCIAFYCGSANGHNLTYKSAIFEIVEQLAVRNISVVYGGGNIGLMGVLGDAATAHGLHITGIIPRSLVDREIAHPGLTELEVVDTMAQRKARMEQLADTYIALPGGVGTLEELSEVLTLQQLGEITGPIVLYNIDGFWTPSCTPSSACATRDLSTRSTLLPSLWWITLMIFSPRWNSGTRPVGNGETDIHRFSGCCAA